MAEVVLPWRPRFARRRLMTPSARSMHTERRSDRRESGRAGPERLVGSRRRRWLAPDGSPNTTTRLSPITGAARYNFLMPSFHRACLRCGYRAESASVQCAECGFSVPLDLRLLDGSMTRWHLSRKRLAVGLVLRTGCGLSIVAVGLALIVTFAFFAFDSKRGAAPSTGAAIALGVAFLLFGLVGCAGLWLLARIPARVRAFLSEGPQPHDQRWAWSETTFWNDARAFPERGEPWTAFDRVTVTSANRVVCIRLGMRPDGRRGPFARSPSLWTYGTAEDAEEIRREIARHVDANGRHPAA